MFDMIESAGFAGFMPVVELRDSETESVPDVPGVYMVLRDSGERPDFLARGSGGYFKGKDPNVPLSELSANWVEGAKVLYIGKAKSLRKRISQYLRFGDGKPVGHWGGRYIWQLADAQELIFCWMPVDGDPDAVETEMISRFREHYGSRPFANLTK
ncbi:MAG: hypothetical protein E7112_08235 [Bacteroidales bacterium]|nr:hypothetical protein [Bacteroidales bacterium]